MERSVGVQCLMSVRAPEKFGKGWDGRYGAGVEDILGWLV